MILSIDPGIKNLGMCIMDYKDKKDTSTYTIYLLENYDLLNEQTCQTIQKNKKICNKKCSFKYGGTFTCKTHACEKSKKYSNHLNKMSIQNIVTKVLLKIREIYDTNTEIFLQITDICIELQPKINRKSSMVSYILFGKLLDLFIDKKITIKFVSAKHKLKVYTGPYIKCNLKTEYSKRKWLSIQYSKWILQNKFSTEQCDLWLPVLEQKGKKCDDISDCFLMNINYIYSQAKVI